MRVLFDNFSALCYGHVHLALSIGLRLNNDLMFGIHSDSVSIALNHAATDFYLGAVVVGDVAFDYFSTYAFWVFMGFKKRIDLVAGTVELFFLFEFTRNDIFVTRLGVVLAVL